MPEDPAALKIRSSLTTARRTRHYRRVADAEPICVRANQGVPLVFSVASIAGGVGLAALGSWWGWLPAAVLFLWAVGTVRSAVQVSDGGIFVRNLVRRRTWAWDQIDEVVMAMGSLPLVIKPMFSLLAVRTKDGTFPLYSTTGLSPARAREAIGAFAAHDCPLGEYVDASVFPMGMFRAVGEARRAKEHRDQEAWAADQAAKQSPDYDGRHL